AILLHIRWSIALENERSGKVGSVVIGPAANLCEIIIANIFGNPNGLERTVAFNGASRIVVDALARSREEPGRRIVLVHDEIGVGFIALKRDTDDHLTKSCPRERVSAAECLRTEDHVNPEGTALANDAIEQHGGGL